MSRSLTGNEISLAKEIFQTSINYSIVKVHEDTYTFFQPSDTLMTPNGEIYAPKDVYKTDYGVESGGWKCLFIHEMTHVWQYQNNILDPRGAGVKEFFRNWMNYANAYYYTLKDGSDLTDYHMEQQAAIVEEFYRVIRRGEGFSKHCKNGGTLAAKKELLKKVMGSFFEGLKK